MTAIPSGRCGIENSPLRARCHTQFVINIGDEIDISDEIEAGWAVARHAGGRGHAMEGTTKALDFAFTNLGTRPSAPSQAR